MGKLRPRLSSKAVQCQSKTPIVALNGLHNDSHLRLFHCVSICNANLQLSSSLSLFSADLYLFDKNPTECLDITLSLHRDGVVSEHVNSLSHFFPFSKHPWRVVLGF